ncbi:hypothetical protein PMAYCL1PPCAC_30047 [Pristionchus mayeri]|uniref:Uncharacterized protein n=1 Tax=Pristionchus mayeri TaxID=1317129 RepID=A0AAN5DC47_9BILA|nr:hypothetical protein PMAYCL1PPCAC_30047 [Pristionchus mayeri]
MQCLRSSRVAKQIIPSFFLSLCASAKVTSPYLRHMSFRSCVGGSFDFSPSHRERNQRASHSQSWGTQTPSERARTNTRVRERERGPRQRLIRDRSATTTPVRHTERGPRYARRLIRESSVQVHRHDACDVNARRVPHAPPLTSTRAESHLPGDVRRKVFDNHPVSRLLGRPVAGSSSCPEAVPSSTSSSSSSVRISTRATTRELEHHSLASQLLPIQIVDRVIGIARRGTHNESKSVLEDDVPQLAITAEEVLHVSLSRTGR